MCRASIGAAALAHARLHLEAMLPCRSQHVALIPWVRYHAAIEVAKHRAFVERCLDIVCLLEGVICRAALEHEGKLWLEGPDRSGNTALPYLLHRRDRGHHIEGQVFLRELPECKEHCCDTCPAVEGLAESNAVLLVVFKLRRRHEGLAHAHMEAFDSLFLRCGTAVEDELLSAGSLLRFAHEVRRLHADDGTDPRAFCRAHEDILSRQHMGREAPELDEAHGAVRADRADHAADLVSMGIEHEDRLRAAEAPGIDQGIHQRIRLHVSPAGAELLCYSHRLILEARRRLRRAQLSQKLCHLIAYQIHCILPHPHPALP